MGELAPPKLVIPTFLIFQSIVIEYFKERVVVENADRTSVV
jgi:hypothetical protein